MLVTIGPVQSYIEQSRKVLDFYNGSKIIGSILKNIIKNISKDIKDNHIILPNLKIDEYVKDSISIPNYFIIKINGSINKETIEKKYENSIENIISEIDIDHKIDDVYRIFDHYIIESSLEDYELAYKDLYKQLSISKNIRIFYNEKISENNKKCPICGIRNEEIIDIETKDKVEKLCYSCYIKRKYSSRKIATDLSKKFPSTADIAVMSWEKSHETITLEEFKKNIYSIINKSIYQMGKKQLYKTEYYFKDVVLGVIDKDKTKDVEQIYDKDYKYLFKRKPTKYYALLKADIDDLGKWMSGEFFYNNCFESNQAVLSKSIINMGKHIRMYVDNKKLGKTIYTGGDDFLILVTLDEIFNVIEELDKYIHRINNILSEKEISKKQLTISKSIVIAHYTTPLQKVISTSFNKLNMVKDKYKYNSCYGQLTKNGTIITYITRSNTLRSTSFNVANSSNDINLIEMQKIIKYLGSKISYNCIYSIENSLKNFETDLNHEELLDIKDIIRSELSRILERKTKKTDKNVTNEFINILMKLVEQSTIELDSNKYNIDYPNIFSYIRICGSLAKEMEGGQVNELCNDNAL